MDYRERLKDKKRIVIKIGSSSLTHKETGRLNLTKMEVLVREITDLCNQGKEVVVVSSGAIGVGRAALGLGGKPERLEQKQACAAIGQARLMMIYQKLFAEYNQTAGQILMTKRTMVDHLNRRNAQNTFEELLQMGVIPIVNDTLSAVVSALIRADLLILLSDIDGLFTDDPREDPQAAFIDLVENMDQHYMEMGKESTGSNVGTGGMATKLEAAKIATGAGADMVIANGKDFHIIHRIMEGKKEGTLYLADPKEEFYLIDYIDQLVNP